MEHLIHDLVECILEKLPLKSLLRFKSVSVQWRSTIESPHFKKRYFICRQSHDPDILIFNPFEFYNSKLKEENVVRIFTMNSSDLIKLPNIFPPRKTNVSYGNYLISGSIDGMICFYNNFDCISVVNPITRWSRSVPQANYQIVFSDLFDECNIRKHGWKGDIFDLYWNIGFGKDKITDTYKLVWLYNSYEIGLENATTCEVFDFSIDQWKYVEPAPCRVLNNQTTIYLDGVLYWFTDEGTGGTIRVLSFDLRTETFRIMLETPFVQLAYNNKIIMCNLNNQLCVSQMEWPRQGIWSLNNSDMTWEKFYSLNLQTDSHLFGVTPILGRIPYTTLCVIPVVVLKNKKSLVLYHALAKNPNLIIYDPELGSYDTCFPPNYQVHFNAVAISYFPSLISIV